MTSGGLTAFDRVGVATQCVLELGVRPAYAASSCPPLELRAAALSCLCVTICPPSCASRNAARRSHSECSEIGRVLLVSRDLGVKKNLVCSADPHVGGNGQ